LRRRTVAPIGTTRRAYGGVTTASADETAARLTIIPIANPIAEIANIRSMAALHR
jgi:hypothetical protein